MSSKKSVTTTTASGGIGLGTILGVLFIGLKLGHVIDWKWVWDIPESRHLPKGEVNEESRT